MADIREHALGYPPPHSVAPARWQAEKKQNQKAAVGGKKSPAFAGTKTAMKHEIIDRFRGCIYGQAIGDALGLGTEFMTDEDIAWKYPDGLHHYNQIFQDRHRKRWKIGDWTDDTDMMLSLKIKESIS